MSAVHRTRPGKPTVVRRRQAISKQTREPKPQRLSARSSGIWWRAGLIVVAGALAYSNSLSGPFVYDDQLSIVENRYIRQLSSPTRVLFPERELPVAGRPLVNVSFAINYAMGGLEVRGYHVWNVATHILCALLLFGIVRRTLNLASLQSRFAGTSTDLAFAAALIWMLHPLNTEAVDYLTQRTELMMGLFYLATLYAAIRAYASPRAAFWQTASVLSCALGMACKESMATAPSWSLRTMRSLSSIRSKRQCAPAGVCMRLSRRRGWDWPPCCGRARECTRPGSLPVFTRGRICSIRPS